MSARTPGRSHAVAARRYFMQEAREAVRRNDFSGAARFLRLARMANRQLRLTSAVRA